MALRSPVPRVDEIIGPGIDALVALRPRALAKLNYGQGQYALVLAGFRAQAATVLRRLGDETTAARLPLATGPTLLELAADEYDTIAPTSPTFAVGTVALLRTGAMPGGVIRAGTRFRVDANDAVQPRVKAATYETTADVICASGRASIPLPHRAQRAGAHANAPLVGGLLAGAPLGKMQIADVLFDPAFTVVTYDSAGGSDGIDDDAVRRQAGSYSRGQYAPTIDAVYAGSYRGTGVRRVDARTITKTTTGNAAFVNVVIADPSWASSLEWQNAVQQRIQNDFLGFGESMRMGRVLNQTIGVTLNITLRDARYAANTRDIDTSVKLALASYFDDRPDWYIWKLAQIRAVVARADRRILTCTSATVTDLASGAVIPEPASATALPTLTNGALWLLHYMLTDNGISTTYVSPS